MRLDFETGIFLVIEQTDNGFKGEDVSCFVRDPQEPSLKELCGSQLLLINIICNDQRTCGQAFHIQRHHKV